MLLYALLVPNCAHTTKPQTGHSTKTKSQRNTPIGALCCFLQDKRCHSSTLHSGTRITPPSGSKEFGREILCANATKYRGLYTKHKLRGSRIITNTRHASFATYYSHARTQNCNRRYHDHCFPVLAQKTKYPCWRRLCGEPVHRRGRYSTMVLTVEGVKQHLCSYRTHRHQASPQFAERRGYSALYCHCRMQQDTPRHWSTAKNKKAEGMKQSPRWDGSRQTQHDQ